MDLSKVIIALDAQKGDVALETLLAMWRAERCVALEEPIIALGERVGDAMTTTLAALCKCQNEAAALEHLGALERLPDDPRVAHAILELLRVAPFYATTSQSFWRLAFQLFARSGHADLAEDLSKALGGRKKSKWGFAVRVSPTMKTWMKKQTARVVLRAPVRTNEVEQLAVVMDAVNKLNATTTRAPLPRGPSDESALLDAIRNDPSSDAPRAVYADWLLERNDPRGEFISLQLERHRRTLTDAEKKRELALLRAHHLQWLGEPATRIGNLRHLAVGLPKEIDLDNKIYFDRGFFVRFQIWSSIKVLEKLAAHPTFVMVEDFIVNHWGKVGPDAWQAQADFLAQPSLRALRRLFVPVDMVPVIARAPYAAKVVYLKTWKVDDDDIALLADAARSFPNLKELVVVSVPTRTRNRMTNRAIMERLNTALPDLAIRLTLF